MKKPLVRITVVSDVVCPWCYIGKRRLEKAIRESAPHYAFEIEYAPFELNPQMPKGGADQQEYLTRKFGSEQRYEQITRHVTQVAAAEGLTFDFEKQHVAPNTRDAHRLIAYAKTVGLQPEVKEAFLKAYFTDGVDLSKPENVVQVAAAAGLDKQAAEEVLRSEAFAREVEQEQQRNHQRGISGVPFYIINEKYGVSGAQPAEVFLDIFSELNKPTVVAQGDACDVETGEC
ncbi:MAG: DsbA family oxidoreductase [Cyclobacteriaceae bacterium]|jgi:predicted DsbA family dithiol-disulfide isomerase|nr:DsbA family oxidoreductase [Cyclobacteriaceae bacterium]